VAKMTVKTLAEMLEQMQTQLAELSRKVEQLEAAQKTQPQALQPAAADSMQTEETRPQITEEELIAISGAIAAYLGVRVRIKQIRLVGSHSWAQQGRVWIQASHKLH